MPTRNIVLTEHQARLVETLVQSGRYQNASEVLRDGLRMVEEQEAEYHTKIEALRRAFDDAEESVRTGDLHEYTPTLLTEIDDEERKRRAGRTPK